MIYSENPVIDTLIAAHSSKDFKNKYFVEMASYGNYLLRDLTGELISTHSSQDEAFAAKKELECKK